MASDTTGVVDDEPSVDDLLADLAAARDAVATAEERIEAHGSDRVQAVADAAATATDLLERYEERATGSGRSEFKAYVEFQDRFAALVEGLDADLPERDDFEAALDAVDKRRLSQRDFDAARAEVEEVGDIASLPDRRATARERLQSVRRAVRDRITDLDDRIADLDRLRDLGAADLDAPVERLRDPIEAYDHAVREAFETFCRERPARELLGFVAATAAYPLVDYRQPPDDLREYLESTPVGEQPIPTLLEYADYSASKLDHYVADTTEFRTNVVVNQTYLERLGPDPLTVGWPPPPPGELRHRCRELIAVVGRFAPDAVVARLRDLRERTRDDDYNRFRTAALARAELTANERERISSGAVAADLETARENRATLSEALEAGG